MKDELDLLKKQISEALALLCILIGLITGMIINLEWTSIMNIFLGISYICFDIVLVLCSWILIKYFRFPRFKKGDESK